MANTDHRPSARTQLINGHSKWSIESFGPSHQALLPKPPPDPVDDKYDECQRHRHRPESPKIRRYHCLVIRRIEVEKLTPTDTLFTFSVATYVISDVGLIHPQ